MTTEPIKDDQEYLALCQNYHNIKDNLMDNDEQKDFLILIKKIEDYDKIINSR